MLKEIGVMPKIIEMMWLMLQDKPEDFVIATGKCYTIRVYRKVFMLELLYLERFRSKRVGINEKDGRVLVKINQNITDQLKNYY